MKLLFAWIFSLLYAIQAGAAACCGGGFAAPAIIAGDNKAQLTSSYSWTEVVVDYVDTNGVWRLWNEHQKVQTFKLEAAHLLSDRWQAGFSLPIIERSRGSESYAGVGDTALTLGYEYLPDWNYNPIRPKGIGYLQLTLPTGKSKVDSEVGGLDSRGQGFWALGMGSLLTKTFGRWDIFASLDLHHSFERNISNNQIQGTLKPGWGGNAGLGAGYNLAAARLGAAITWTAEDPMTVLSDSQISTIHREAYATSVFSVSLLHNEDWAGTVTYSDQTLFGSPVNTSLGRGLALQLQKKWSR